jgi:hypothetical protein
MKKILIIYLSILLIMSSFSLISNVKASTKIWTICCFIDADNSLDEYADYDIDEIWTVGSDSNINIIVYVDYKERPTKLYYINQKPIPNTELSLSSAGLPDEPNSADRDTLYYVMKYCYTVYPSTYFAVIVWNHGIGWGGNNADDTSEDITNLREMKSAFSKFYTETDKIIDLFGFDQCLMGEVSVIYNVKNYVNYVVASEDLVPALGWYYTYPLQKLSLNPSMSVENFGKEIIDGYNIYYSGVSEYTLSLLNITYFEQLSHKLNYYSQALEHRAGSYWSSIYQAISNTEKYVAYADLVNYDLYDFTEQLETRITNTTIIALGKDVRSLINYTVAYEKHGVGRPESTGLSIYLARKQGSYNSLYENSYWCDENAHDEFLNEYIIKSNGYHNEPSMPTMQKSGTTLYINNSVEVPQGYGSMVKVNRGNWLYGTILYSQGQSGVFFARTWNGDDYSDVNASTFIHVTKIITQYTGIEYTLYFKTGWNMFGLPLEEEELSAQSLLAGMDNGIELVKRSSSNRWIIFVNEKTSPNDDFDLGLGEGYYIYVGDNTFYTFKGVSKSHTITLTENWNLISYSGEDTTASAFCNLVNGDNTLTYRDVDTGKYESFIEKKGLGENFDINKGDAFFIWDDNGESITI